MTHGTPLDYTARARPARSPTGPNDLADQPQVFALIRFLMRHGQLRRIIHIGGGLDHTLRGLDLDTEVIWVASASLGAATVKDDPRVRFLTCDLETGLPDLSAFIEGAIVVCAGVFEHLQRPDRLAEALARLSGACPYLLISTPDRTRVRGLMDRGPPADVTRVREWTADEFGLFLRTSGFNDNVLLGYTVNGSTDPAKTVVLCLAGREAGYIRPRHVLSVAAIINVFNESDVIEPVVRHLKGQGVQVHIVDNWSTDGSWEIAQTLMADGLCANAMRFPAAPPPDYDWKALLRHSADYARTLSADWIIHYDADEFRSAPWPCATLAEAISFVDSLGYSAIDFTILNFRFVDTEDEVPFSLETRRWFEPGRHSSDFVRVNAWKNQRQLVDLASYGGHIAWFQGMRPFPLKFLTRHYPLRSSAHAAAKIFKDRLPRFEREKKELGWHIQYDMYRYLETIKPWHRYELMVFDPAIFNADFLVERLSGIGIEAEERLPPSLENLYDAIAANAQERRAAEAAQARLTAQVAELDDKLTALRVHLAAIKHSTSWRMTAPIRWLKDCLTRAAGRRS